MEYFIDFCPVHAGELRLLTDISKQLVTFFRACPVFDIIIETKGVIQINSL